MSMSIPPEERWAPLAGEKEEITRVSLSGNCSVQRVTPKTRLQHSDLHASPEGSKVPSKVPCQHGPAGSCIPLPLRPRLLAGGSLWGWEQQNATVASVLLGPAPVQHRCVSTIRGCSGAFNKVTSIYD